MLLDSQEQLRRLVGTANSVEKLRAIVAARELREVSYAEAQDIGSSLIEFYTLLAEGVDGASAD